MTKDEARHKILQLLSAADLAVGRAEVLVRAAEFRRQYARKIADEFGIGNDFGLDDNVSGYLAATGPGHFWTYKLGSVAWQQ